MIHSDIHRSVTIFQELEIEANQKYVSAKEGLPALYRWKIYLKHHTDLPLLEAMLNEN